MNVYRILTVVPRLAFASVLALLAAPVTARIDALDYLGSYDSGAGEGAAEIAAFDPATDRLFVLNAAANTVEVVDLSNPSAPVFLSALDIAPFGANANSVAVSRGVAAVAVQADLAQDPGRVAFFNADGAPIGDAEVGALPDMVTFTPDGGHVLVANEGEPNDEYTVDPEGSVSIVRVPRGGAAIKVTTVGFTDFNAGGARAGELPADVRVFGPGASVAQDLEPEYIAVSPDGTTAWVSLQEANALAVIDIPSATVARIDALGFKDHSRAGNALDVSDDDGGIRIRNWPVLGMYQPDAIAVYSHGGVPLVVSANEGDARGYGGFSEEVRVADLLVDPKAFPSAATLQEDENLGRLWASNALADTDGDGDFDGIYTFGARSFSIWNGATGALVWDSGDDFERVTADEVPAIFNADESDPDELDARSVYKGPEPEALAVGRIGERTYAFVGLERVGGFMVYDVTDPASPTFVLYEPSAPGDVSPEAVVFVPAEDSPNGRALLLASHENSGTVSVYQVLEEGDEGLGTCFAEARAVTFTKDSGSGIE